MPIYAFACIACGHAFDKLQRLSDPDPTVCPVCGAEDTVKRQLTAPSFRLSGSGWYETDFKKDGDRKRNLAGEGGEGAKPATTDSAKAEPARPDAKPDPKPAESKPAATPAPAATPKPAPKTD